jgi:hypothetical protein
MRKGEKEGRKEEGRKEGEGRKGGRKERERGRLVEEKRNMRKKLIRTQTKTYEMKSNIKITSRETRLCWIHKIKIKYYKRKHAEEHYFCGKK